MLDLLPVSLPFIFDPWFYAVAVPAVLLTGLSKSGFATGFGALATPLIALTLPAPQAAAIMLPLLSPTLSPAVAPAAAQVLQSTPS